MEVGTGTGIIALHVARLVPAVATDISPHAVRLCRANARLNGIALEVLRADLFGSLRGVFDLIVFNPPYLPIADADGWLGLAWSGGSDGNSVILRFLEQAGDHLAPGGRIVLLLSSHNSRALRRAEELYRVRLLGRERFLFEEISVHELMHT